MKKIDEHIKRYLNKTSSEEQQNELWIKSRQIGKGENKNEVDNIEHIFKNNVLKNKLVLQKLSDIVENKFLLYGYIKEIQVYSSYISNDIVKEVYTTTAKCCPTVWKSLRESMRLPL